MGNPFDLRFSIALCIVMVAATFAPGVRRVMPRWFEMAVWGTFIFVCWLGIASIKEPHARELTDSVNWAVGQIATTLVGLAGSGVHDALVANRFVIANAVVTLFGADLLALALISSHKKGQVWQPKVRLGEWLELPVAAATAAPIAEPVPYAVAELNERWAAATSTAGVAAANWSVHFLIWARDVGLPRAEERLALAMAVGRIEAKVLLESVRETAREVEAGARSVYQESAPEVNKLALRVAAILNGVTDAEQPLASSAGRLAPVVDIQALRIAQSLGHSGRATSTDEKVEENGPEHADELAS